MSATRVRAPVNDRSPGRWLVFVIALFVAVGTAQAAEAKLEQLSQSLELVVYRSGTKPPQFAGRTLDAQPLSLTGLRGKVVLMNFWASWCLECRPEMPALDQLHREFAARGLVVVGINVREAAETARRYAREVGMSFPLMLDPDGQINALYGIVGVPTTFVVGRNGRAVAFAVGSRKWGGPAARALIEALLAEPVPQ